jgi:hypothetical protein
VRRLYNAVGHDNMLFTVRGPMTVMLTAIERHHMQKPR